MKKVVDEFGRTVVVDDSNKSLYSFCNRTKTITYNAEIMEGGKHSGFFTNYSEKGTISDIEEKLKVWNNMIRFEYAKNVGFDSEKNDPDREKWKKVVEYVKQNENLFFTKTGDFRKKFLVSIEKILK